VPSSAPSAGNGTVLSLDQNYPAAPRKVRKNWEVPLRKAQVCLSDSKMNRTICTISEDGHTMMFTELDEQPITVDGLFIAVHENH